VVESHLDPARTTDRVALFDDDRLTRLGDALFDELAGEWPCGGAGGRILGRPPESIRRNKARIGVLQFPWSVR
jgi:hypothetical protein